MKNKNYSLFFLFIVYFLLGFPMFYFVYKFGNPAFGTSDFFDYYPIFKDFNMEGVKSPFNIRLVSTFFVYLFNKMNFHYDTECTFDQFNLDKQVFFNAIFFNFLCIVSTCVLIFRNVNAFLKNSLLAFVSGLIYLLGFGTLFYEYMPITDAFSILVFAISFNLYLSRNLFIIVPLLVLIFQREYIFLIFGLIAFLDFFKYKTKYYMVVLLMCIFCMGAYFVLRKTVFYTSAFASQFSPGEMISSLFTLKMPLGAFVKQMAMTLNIFILYLLIVVYKKVTKLNIDSYNLWKILALFLQVIVVTFAESIGNNAGRIFYFTVPLIIFYMARETAPLVKKFDHESGESQMVN